MTRPKHWLEFAPFQMAHTPLKMTIPEVQAEVRAAWLEAYSPAETERAIESIASEAAPYKISHFAARLFFRGIFFPPGSGWNWLKLIARNRKALFRIVKDSTTDWHGQRDPALLRDFHGRLPASSGD